MKKIIFSLLLFLSLFSFVSATCSVSYLDENGFSQNLSAVDSLILDPLYRHQIFGEEGMYDEQVIFSACLEYTGSTGVNVFYNTTHYFTDKSIFLQNTTFQKFEDATGVYFNAEPSNNIDFNGIPVNFTGTNFVISGNYDVFITGGVLYIQDFVSSGVNYTGFELLQFTGIVASDVISGTTEQLVQSSSQAVIGLFMSNIPKIISALLVLLVVYILLRLVRVKKNHGQGYPIG